MVNINMGGSIRLQGDEFQTVERKFFRIGDHYFIMILMHRDELNGRQSGFGERCAQDVQLVDT